MTTFAFHSSVRKILSLSWLTGPIFDKELRVSSRRKRNYTLRMIYVILLSIFVAIVWLSVVKSEGSSVYEKSRMALAGKTIVTTIVMFQFFATQVIAVIMLSTSISDEIYHRTLGLLMTTPISSFQIVMGKLFSKLLQLILLLAISLPLLAIVRIFGGVPWEYVLSSLCITLTAVIFAGTLSLFFSINNRRAYVVIIKTVVTLGVLYFFIPTITTVLLTPRFLYAPIFGNPVIVFPLLVAFLHLNPLGAMSLNTAMMISPAAAAMIPAAPAGVSFFYWPLHCVLMLGASALLIAISVKVVRKVALRQAVGQIESVPNRTRAEKSKKLSRRSAKQQDFIRRVAGPPVLWRELRAPMIQGAEGRNSIIGLAIAIIALLITYGTCRRYLDEAFTQVGYAMMFTVIGSVFTIILSATSVTSEKETRSWPILLATSMDDWHILMGKAIGVFRRCLPIWLLMAGHIFLFVCIKYIHPIAILHIPIFLAGLVVFLTGAGLYFSAFLKRTTSAVIASFALALALWVVLPALLGLVSVFTRDYDAVGKLVSANPAAQLFVLMDGAGGSYNARAGFSNLNFDWPDNPSRKIWPTTGLVLIYMLIYTLAGVLFGWRAKCRFRRNVF
ncbi:MAG: ABC transporter permease subunit [Planctomycetota bacterium]|jgi:ABC-type transport system involved in multi-copper enzyme maturation permease subunit